MIDEENKKREAVETLEVSMTPSSYPRKGKQKDRRKIKAGEDEKIEKRYLLEPPVKIKVIGRRCNVRGGW